ncbi:hypothetical protein [Halalkalibacter krulwichiae]|uniref:Uncharacterized protein n=1 Tax=Halalkalibacter krulwichiae TaxID=199441 RepID=A0A1X9M8T3_9BACI|nr:hypothetical protein [Halalkalibacter krulwichiae]ARK29806.1 hypothetical protein BkAM31D_07990 [Halalkalibacter krulwichiae]
MLTKERWKVFWQGYEYDLTVKESSENVQVLRRNEDDYFIAFVRSPISTIKIKELGLKYQYIYFIYTYQEDEQEPYRVVCYKNKKIITLDTTWLSFMDVLTYLYEGFGFDLEDGHEIISE